jgi:drug/metabolite transporter (DMT)-like permease
MSQRDRVHEDVKIEAMQEASAALSVGVLFLAVSGIAGIFFFQTFRSGTDFWSIYTSILGAIGVLLTAIGMRGRRQNS